MHCRVPLALLLALVAAASAARTTPQPSLWSCASTARANATASSFCRGVPAPVPGACTDDGTFDDNQRSGERGGTAVTAQWLRRWSEWVVYLFFCFLFFF
jgi:hypothetical protein